MTAYGGSQGRYQGHCYDEGHKPPPHSEMRMSPLVKGSMKFQAVMIPSITTLLPETYTPVSTTLPLLSSWTMAWTALWLRLQCLLLLCQCREDEVLRKQVSMPLQEILTATLRTWTWLISTNKTFSRRWCLCPQTTDTIPGQQYRKEGKSCRCDDLRESRSRQPKITSSTPATDCTSRPLKLTQENFSEISLSWEWSHQLLWKYSHTRVSTVSLATEVAPRSDALETLASWSITKWKPTWRVLLLPDASPLHIFWST